MAWVEVMKVSWFYNGIKKLILGSAACIQSSKVREMLAPQMFFFVVETRIIFMCCGANYKCQKDVQLSLLSLAYEGETVSGLKSALNMWLLYSTLAWGGLLHKRSILGRIVDFSSTYCLVHAEPVMGIPPADNVSRYICFQPVLRILNVYPGFRLHQQQGGGKFFFCPTIFCTQNIIK